MKTFALLSLVCSAMAVDLNDYTLSYKTRFEQYKKDMAKIYKTPTEESAAFDAWKTNDDIIRESNSNTSLTFKLGHNAYSDMTNKDFKAMLGFHPNPHASRPRNVDYTLGQRVKDTPDSIDWSELGAVTPIKNQEQCGSCWAFSTTGSVEGAYYIATKHLISLSEQQLVSCDKIDNGCEGGLMDNGFKFAETYGICKEEDYPYISGSGISFQCHGEHGNCTAVVKVTNYTDVPEKDEDALQVAVASQPVSVAVEADRSAFQLYKSGIMASPFCGTKLDHGVLIVGYGAGLLGEKYWKVKNSWGATWGEEGFIRLGRGNNVCGISQQASFPGVEPL